MRAPRRTRGSPRGSRRFAGRIAAVRATRLVSRGRRRRRRWHAAAVSGARSRPAFLKTPRSRASHARDRARGDALERARGVVDGARRAWHRYRAYAAPSTTRAPPSVSPPPSPARVRASARTHRSRDARRRRRNPASRARATRDATPGIARAVGTCAHLSWTWCLLCCVDSALLCAVEKGEGDAGAPVKSTSKAAPSFSAFLLVPESESLKILESLDPRIRGVLEAHFRRFFCT